MYTASDIPPLLPVLHRRARNLCRNTADAKDLVQNTVLKALTRIQTVVGNLKGWLMRIMFHLFHDRYRRGAGKRGEYRLDNPHISIEEFHNSEDLLGTREDIFGTADTAGEEGWDVQHVLRLVEQIPEPFRRTLLAIAAGADYEEVAAQEGVNPTTIRTRVNRARAHLRSLVGESPLT